MSRYLDKHAMYPPFFKPPEKKIDFIVVIPCYNEPDILTVLSSLNICTPLTEEVEVIVVVNHSESDLDNIKSKNKKIVEDIKSFIATVNPWFNLLVIEVEFPSKDAGVGLARKTGMDEAIRRLEEAGAILCLDADCSVSKDYFKVLKNHFSDHANASGASIYYEHPLSGNLPKKLYDAILQYELHLRYYVFMQRKLKLPYAFHTVGSSMAVTGKAYEAVGGMNKRKAGEDFYFIMKLIKYGRFTSCNDTTVHPSPRISDRVPFGTGRAIGEMIESNEEPVYCTYPPLVFEIIKDFITACLNYYHTEIVDFSQLVDGWKANEFIINKLKEIKCNTSDYQSFMRRYFKWFDGFQLMKLLHHLRDHGHSLVPVEKAARQVLGKGSHLNGRCLLDHYRKIDSSA